MNNLGVAYSDLEMPASSVRSHHAAFNLGNTLSAGNLAYKYLDGGMIEDAKKLLDEVAKIPDHDIMVENAQAELKRRLASESEKEEEIRELALRQKDFFKRFGRACLVAGHTEIAGTWAFPFCDIELKPSASGITGSGRKTVRQSPWGSLFSTGTRALGSRDTTSPAR